MQDHPTYAAALTAITRDSLTALPFTLAALPVAVREEAHSLAAEAVCAIGERSMRPRQPGRLARFAHSIARKAAMLWDGCPGPWPVKVLLVGAAIAEPGPFGEIALAAIAGANAARKARKAAAR